MTTRPCPPGLYDLIHQVGGHPGAAATCRPPPMGVTGSTGGGRQPGTGLTPAPTATAGRSGRLPERMQYENECRRCGRHVPQDVQAAICQGAGCSYLLCVVCWPNLAADMWCGAHEDQTAGAAQGGQKPRGMDRGKPSITLCPSGRDPVVVTATTTLPLVPSMPPGARQELHIFFVAIATIIAAVVVSSAAAMERADREFTRFLELYGVARSAVTSWIVAAYVLARVCPPFGVPLPDSFVKTVAPSTAATDLSLLRRKARIEQDVPMLSALCGDEVSMVNAQLSGAAKTKTNKAPILLHHIEDAWQKGKRTLGFIRNITLLLIGLLIGLRRRELVALRQEDVQWDDGRKELRVSIVKDKTNFSIIDAQAPRVVIAAHALLDEIWPIFASNFALDVPRGALFPVMTGSVAAHTHLSPATINTIVREMLPGLAVSPHSLRVGCATELHAAGKSLPLIMEIGRWRSLTALHYVLPSADMMAAATRSIGGGAITFDRAVLQRSLGTAPDTRLPRVRCA